MPQRVTTPTSDSVEQTHRWLEGRAVLFTLWTTGLPAAQTAAQSLEGSEQKLLVAGTDPHYAPSGHVIFARESSLWAVPFDARRLEVTGDPRLLVAGVQVNDGGHAMFAVANDGTLAYVPVGQSRTRTLVWVDREGREEPVPGLPSW